MPAILEYIPYRRRDGTRERDATTHPYFAGHGYACVRVDIRGTGDSDGVILDEYLKQEQDDAVEVIAWLAAQPWCSGKVGMIGISWGGFNGLQVAARRPPALKAIVTVCSTDDRYADDMHYMGGCLLIDNLEWGSTIFSITPRRPIRASSASTGARCGWSGWSNDGLCSRNWLRHQRRDDLWKHGSVCEDWRAIQCAVYAVGGWADGYTNAVFRLLAQSESARARGWSVPGPINIRISACPGPAIGFLQECLRWWDHWLKGQETGIMDEPMLRVWLEDPRRRRSPITTTSPGTGWPRRAGRARASAERRWRLERVGSPRARGTSGRGRWPSARPQTVGARRRRMVPLWPSA